MLFRSMGELGKAETVLEDLVRREPKWAPGYYALARVLFVEGKFPDALRAANEAERVKREQELADNQARSERLVGEQRQLADMKIGTDIISASGAGAGGATMAAPKAQRRVHLGGWTQVPVFDFLALGADQAVSGPAIVESDTTTVLLRPGDVARYDARGWLDITVG